MMSSTITTSMPRVATCFRREISTGKSCLPEGEGSSESDRVVPAATGKSDETDAAIVTDETVEIVAIVAIATTAARMTSTSPSEMLRRGEVRTARPSQSKMTEGEEAAAAVTTIGMEVAETKAAADLALLAAMIAEMIAMTAEMIVEAETTAETTVGRTTEADRTTETTMVTEAMTDETMTEEMRLKRKSLQLPP